MESEELISTKLLGKEYEYLNKHFGHTPNRCFIECRGTILRSTFEPPLNQIQEMEVRSDDVWLHSFPKSGTAWSQEMIWCVANNVDLEAAKIPLWQRFPYLNLTSTFNFSRLGESKEKSSFEKLYYSHFSGSSSEDIVNNWPSRRFVRTHLPFHLLPKKLQMNEIGKMIYVLRHPADVCVSHYHFCKWRYGYTGGFDEFCENFLEGKVLEKMVSNRLNWLLEINHVTSSLQSGFRKKRSTLDHLIDLSQDIQTALMNKENDLKSVIKKVADFLGETIAEEKMEILLEHLSFDNMKKNPAIIVEEQKSFSVRGSILKNKGEYLRSGKAGGWKAAMKPELKVRFEKWIEDNLRGTDLRFHE